MVKIILLQLYWLSFIFIGFAEILVYVKLAEVRSQKLCGFLKTTHILIATLIFFCTGLTSLILVVIPSFLFHLHIIFLEIAYITLIVLSAFVIFRYRFILLNQIRRVELNKPNVIKCIIVGSVLLIDFWGSLHSGGIVTGDAKFEIAQINMFAHSRFTLIDPIFGNLKEPLTIYSLSIFHASQANAVSLLNKTAPWVWFYSSAFFRFIIWICVFSLAWEFLDRKIKSNLSYIILMLLPILYGEKFIIAELHNTLVIAWTALFIIGIKVWLSNKSTFLIYISSILIASSHPLNSFMAASFLLLLIIILVVRKNIVRAEILSIIPAVILLLLPVGLFLYLPHGLTSSGFNDTPFSGPAIDIVRFGPFYLSNIKSNINFLYFFVNVLILSLLYMSVRIKNLYIRIVGYISLITGLILFYEPSIISFFGFIYLFIKTENKKIKLELVLLLIFSSLVIYNPIVLKIVYGRFPLWALSRFIDFNVLALISSIIGLFCILLLPIRDLANKKLYKGIVIMLPILYIFVIPVVYPVQIYDPLRRSNFNPVRRADIDELDTIKGFNSQLKDQIIFSDDQDLPILIPEVITSNAFTINNAANASPLIHLNQRQICSSSLLNNFDTVDLEASGITSIITHSPVESNFSKLLKNNSDVIFEKQIGEYRVFKVNKIAYYKTPKGNSKCTIDKN